MHRRKIQLIAGTTYSVSLPKEWVKKNNLAEKDEILISEKNDRTLVLSHHLAGKKELNEISLDIDDYPSNIDQILFAAYYLGIENIKLSAKQGLKKGVKARIRKTLTHMSGTEISYEDDRQILIKVLLDKEKVDVIQTLYRIILIIESSISNILENFNIDEIRINENEIDRLYHLITKIISLSLVNSNVLISSNIKNALMIPPYFLISKRLEHTGDNINHLSEYLHKNKASFKNKKEVLDFIKTELDRSIRYIMSRPSDTFEKMTDDDFGMISNLISKAGDNTVSNYLAGMIRYIIDIEEEIVNISFYNQLISKGML